MKEIPILFSTPMVQAILEGRKSQTRRLVKWPKVPDWHDWDYDPDAVHRPKGGSWWPWFTHRGGSKDISGPLNCPYGIPGDVLFVRENWQLKGWDFEEGAMKVKYATGETQNCTAHDPTEDSEWLMDHVDRLEKGGYIIATPGERFEFTSKKQPFKPSIHMPKVAARIWLQVTDVRVERLKDISEVDAIAEGVERLKGVQFKDEATGIFRDYTHKDAFELLWEEINGADSWNANPFVWVVKFTILSTTGKPDLNNIQKQ